MRCHWPLCPPLEMGLLELAQEVDYRILRMGRSRHFCLLRDKPATNRLAHNEGYGTRIPRRAKGWREHLAAIKSISARLRGLSRRGRGPAPVRSTLARRDLRCENRW